MRQVVKILAVALLLTAVWTSAARAATGFFDCEVSVAGMASSASIVVRLSDLAASPAFTNRWFVGIEPIVKEMLATAFVAMTNDSPVLCNVDTASSPPRIFLLYLKK